MLYDLAFLLFSVFYLPTLVLKGKLHRDFPERFGVYSRGKKAMLAAGNQTIWIQAVSVGEVGLCRNLVPLLRKRYPDNRLVISTVTKAGNDLAKKVFSEYATIIYFPLDFSFTVRRAVRMIRPRIYIMVETEIWPNLLRHLSQKGVRSILINGRISENSFARYRAVKVFLSGILRRVDAFCMQSRDDARKIACLGAPEEKIKATGSMKFDLETASSDRAASEEMRLLLDLEPEEELLVAGSTHRGEEDMIASLFNDLTGDFPKLKLLIAPRHVDRVEEIEVMLRGKGLIPVRVSELKKGLRVTGYGLRVLILDTIGQLGDVYAAATVVFIGGSIVRHGGQNPIEAAVVEKPIIFGPYMFNFKEIAKALIGGKAAIQVSDRQDLLERVKFLLQNKEERLRLGANAKKVVLENRGATAKNLEIISEILIRDQLTAYSSEKR